MVSDSNVDMDPFHSSTALMTMCGDRLTVFLRISCIILSTFGLIALYVAYISYNHVYTDGMGQIAAVMALIGTGISLFWSLLYLLLRCAHVKVLLPIVITFELLAWLALLSMECTAIGMTSYLMGDWPGCPNYGGARGGTRDAYCIWGNRSTASMIAGTVLSLLAGLVFSSKYCVLCSSVFSIAHFVLFIRAIKAIQREKKMRLHGTRLEDSDVGLEVVKAQA